ncbi:enoyl-CoA hydratase/isomerase family protein [Alkalihalobacillus sp. AL-G]|uniref:enoyl-CoA hydratase/isomerase family protein n=1 Tax=Alkalihalobacillus sp. AL-G TaxID=2926399 RepID=UPI00272C04FD|nr:enoyl-CoA hydratase/isomerase family protein [Alkalihalobacillus sp. AL-G]WLD93081.1 enoyl-CoA hydratase/isomerase family protein [Alkalihalobacillus sp. AL-G]
MTSVYTTNDHFLSPTQPEDADFEKVIYEKKDGVATVTINRPEVYNCLNFQTLREMTRAFELASWDDEIGVVVLTGAGDKAFCTGADMKEQNNEILDRPRNYWKWMGAFIEAHEKLKNIGKPTIARLNGITVGGGNEFNINCDLAVMADHGYIKQVGNSHGSVAAGGATQWLPLIVGDRRAREILWLNEEITPDKALEWGLVNEVVPAHELDDAVDRLAKKLLNKLPECVRYTKEQTNFWRNLSFNMTVQHARDWLSVHTGSYETYESMRAFSEKRKPDYEKIRARAASGGSSEHLWGAPMLECDQCGTKDIPEYFNHCGVCGAPINK